MALCKGKRSDCGKHILTVEAMDTMRAMRERLEDAGLWDASDTVQYDNAYYGLHSQLPARVKSAISDG